MVLWWAGTLQPELRMHWSMQQLFFRKEEKKKHKRNKMSIKSIY